MINVEVSKNPNENSLGLIRRFTKSVQGAGVLVTVKGNRYKEREESKYKRKKKTLNRLKRKIVYDELFKLGKIVEKKKRR